jgi:hypothetical protein
MPIIAGLGHYVESQNCLLAIMSRVPPDETAGFFAFGLLKIGEYGT